MSDETKLVDVKKELSELKQSIYNSINVFQKRHPHLEIQDISLQHSFVLGENRHDVCNIELAVVLK